MSDLIDLLRRLNSKERFFLVAHIQDQVGLKLGPFFRGRLSQKLGIMIPEDAFVAMDYHLDWLYAALYVAEHGEKDNYPNSDEKGQQVIHGQQEDVDLLVAFSVDALTHLVLIEAKGVTGWTNEQLKSKADRLEQIFNKSDGLRWKNVQPHFLLMSPKEPGYAAELDAANGICTDTFPAWMKSNESKRCQKMLPWLSLPIADRDELIKVTRCNDKWMDWKIEKR